MSHRWKPRVTLGIAALAFTVVAVVSTSAPAWACSLEQRPQPMRVVPGADDIDVPRNVIFAPPAPRGGLDADSYFWEVDDTPVDLEVDQTATDILTFGEPYDDLSTTVYRPTSPLEPGSGIAACYRDSCGEQRSTVTADVDETPPTRPVIEDIEITLYDNPLEGRGTFCPELDSIRIELSASDDTTPLELHRVLIFAGATRDAIGTDDAPDAAVGGELTDDGARLRIESWLGLDSARQDYYSPFSRTPEVCFSLALMDWAGNVSERTETECVDTRDPDGPYANVVEGAGCGCSSARHPAHSTASLLLAALGLLALRTYRRRV